MGSGNARLQLGGNNQTLAGLNDSIGAGVVQDGGFGGFTPTGNATLTLDGSGTYSFAGFFRDHDTGGIDTLSLVLNGSGTQTLSGVHISYTGPTTISSNGSTLILQTATAFASPVTINPGTTLQLNNTSSNVGLGAGATINLQGALAYTASANTFYETLAGAVTVNATSTIDTTGVAGSNAGLYFDGGLKGSSPLTITGHTGGVGVVLRNTSSTYSGTMTVNGTASTTPSAASGLAVDGDTTGLANANITVNGTMELGNLSTGMGNAGTASTSFQMNALGGTGVVIADQNSASTLNFSVGNNNGIGGIFTGVIANGTNDTLSFTKNGTGTHTLSGTNTYTGATIVNGGTLLLDFSQTGAPASNILSATAMRL